MLGGPSPAPTSKATLIWGVGGVALILGQAIWRLSPHALEPWLSQRMNLAQQSLYVGWVLLNGYTEGYRAFQKRFCPRVVERAWQLAQAPSRFQRIFAPLFCMGLLGGETRQRLRTWAFLFLLILLVIAVKQLHQPWRGIVDGGVVIGLLWGVFCLFGLLAQGLRGAVPPSTPS